jgi:hypothetical protein
MLLAALVAVVVAGTVPSQAEEARGGVWNPAVGGDLLQPGYNLSGDSREFHLTLIGVHASFFRLGRFRFPSVGLDFQARAFKTRGPEEYIWSGHWLATSGIAFAVNEKDQWNPEQGVHAKAYYDLRKDRDPRVGRWGVVVGYYASF